MIYENVSSIDIKSYKNGFGVRTVCVTITYYSEMCMETFTQKRNVRQFFKSEGTPWGEFNSGKFKEVKGGNSLYLNQYCQHIGCEVPND